MVFQDTVICSKCDLDGCQYQLLLGAQNKIEADARVLAALEGALIEIRHLASRDGPPSLVVALRRIEEGARIALQVLGNEQTVGKNDR
jgi:hypothetical protein